MIELTTQQTAVLKANGSSFLLGPAGTGKSTALQYRLHYLLEQGANAYNILLLVAEPAHRQQFLNKLYEQGVGPYTDLQISSYSELAHDMVKLFWPLIARSAGFKSPARPPTILTYDLAQLLLWRIVTPMIQGGAFVGLRLRPQQIVSQILDTLNRAALNRLSLQEGMKRQISSWGGEKDRIVHLQEATVAAQRFRDICFENSLLDLSLISQVFDTQLVQHPQFNKYFTERYQHLFVDNVEEQTPAGQNFMLQLLPHMKSAVIAYDAGGGYKRFLGADPKGANRFLNLCQNQFDFQELTYLSYPPLFYLSNLVENQIYQTDHPVKDEQFSAKDGILHRVGGRYRREMVNYLIPILQAEINAGVLPNQIAIVVPYLDGALRYMLSQALSKAGLSYQILRRRSTPREEPRIRSWLSWLALAYPEWGIPPHSFDVAEALSLSIESLDPVRAALLVDQLYQVDENRGHLLPIRMLDERYEGRIPVEIREQYEMLRLWLSEQDSRMGLDQFLHHLFHDLLGKAPFRTKPDLVGGAICDWLVRTATRLRLAAEGMNLHTSAEIGQTFIQGIYQGLVSADPPNLGEPPDPNGIQIGTIYGYLLSGKGVDVQVWLETAATGWWDMPRQPLSNSFVLAQSWAENRVWTAEDDLRIRDELMSRIVRGLTARCRKGIIIASSDLDRRGVRQDGRLWRALQPVLED